VFKTLLQLLDDGRLTDGQGRTVNSRNVRWRQLFSDSGQERAQPGSAANVVTIVAEGFKLYFDDTRSVPRR
jgi:hypothetical protein